MGTDTGKVGRSVRAETHRAGPRSPTEPTVRELARAVVEARWQILGLVALSGLAAAAYLVFAPPVYRASALLQIRDPANTPVRVENLSPLFDQKSPAVQKTSVDGEIEILRSRQILGQAVDELGLGVAAAPRYLPGVGEAIARLRRAKGPAAPLLGLPQFAWGGERIEVARLRVSDELVHRPLTLVALAGGRYEVRDRDGTRLLQGEVGVPAAGDVAGHHVEVQVRALEARPGTGFVVERLPVDDVVERLQQDLRVQEHPKDSGIVTVELDGRDPARIARIVSTLATVYVQRNAEQRSAETAKTLEYLEAQLPQAKRAVDAAEAELAAYRTRRRSVDLQLEAKHAADRVAELEKTLSDLEAERAQARRTYGDRYPEVVRLDARIQAVRAQLAGTDPRVEAQPSKELDATRLARTVASATDVYTLLLKQVQELRVVKSGLVNNVRLVDAPVVAHRPVRPRPAATIALALLVSLAGAVAIALARSAFGEERIRDPRELEAALGMPVLANVPHSARQATLARSRRRATLATVAPEDVAVEQLRALRTSLGFLLKARGNVVALSSPSPGVGKSFVAMNLAELFAAAGKRVLLVDADLRCGVVDARFDEPGPGLADVLLGKASIEEATRTTPGGKLDVVCSGGPVERPAELLATPRLQEILAAVGQRYDVVVVDTPPALAVTDPVLVARCASVNLLVLRARHHPVREVAFVLERLEQSGAEVHGAILNEAEASEGYVYEHRATGRRRSAARRAS